jgi:hypothetical protein
MLPKMEAATAWSLPTNKESQVGVVGGGGSPHAAQDGGCHSLECPHQQGLPGGCGGGGGGVHMMPKMEAATAWSLLTNKATGSPRVGGGGGEERTGKERRHTVL